MVGFRSVLNPSLKLNANFIRSVRTKVMSQRATGLPPKRGKFFLKNNVMTMPEGAFLNTFRWRNLLLVLAFALPAIAQDSEISINRIEISRPWK